MAVTIQINRSANATAPGSPAYGELGYTFGAGGQKLYIGDSGNSALIIGGKHFTDKLDHTDGTLTADSFISVDSNSAVDTINIGNNTGTGGLIKLNEGTLNGANYIAHAAPNSIGTSYTYTWPEDGTADRYLMTDGAGGLSWAELTTSLSIAGDTGSGDTVNLLTGTLTVAGGEGITTDRSTDDTIHIAGEDASDSNKGIASFDSTDFSVTSGAVSLSTTPSTYDQVNIDNLRLDGNTLSSTDTDGNITLDPNGTGVVDVSTSRITNVTDPTGSQDAATKSYVDATASGLDVKESVRVATTVAGTLASDYEDGDTVDGITLATDDRILIKDQGTGSENGIYIVRASGAPTRATDFDGTSGGGEDPVTTGAFVFVEVGSTNASTGWVLSTAGTITIDTTALTFTQFSGAGLITAGNGLTKTGNTIDVVPGDGLDVAADEISVDLKTNGGIVIESTEMAVDLGASSITGTLGVGDGGSGLSTAAKGTVLIANAVDTIQALDGSTESDLSSTATGILIYQNATDVIGWTTAIDGGTF